MIIRKKIVTFKSCGFLMRLVKICIKRVYLYRVVCRHGGSDGLYALIDPTLVAFGSSWFEKFRFWIVTWRFLVFMSIANLWRLLWHRGGVIHVYEVVRNVGSEMGFMTGLVSCLSLGLLWRLRFPIGALGVGVWGWDDLSCLFCHD